ncbi:protein lplB [Paenibacillus swuensis]|uniref:Protein lplB n=1 Tax=Paenibacillus swuensis TaxID=1178515 RepID=A0A172TN33_9BACL|nr:protein lplB [Paenibacillus swuensis]
MDKKQQSGVIQVPQTATARPTVSRRKSYFRKHTILYAMLLPPILFAFIFSYLPMAGLVMAFQDYQPWTGFTRSEWVGLEHFKLIFTLPDTIQVTFNTLVIAVGKIAANMVVPFIFALLLNEVRHVGYKRTVQTLVYLPHFMNWVIIGGILMDVLSPSGGLINRGMSMLGVEPVFFLGEGGWFRFTMIASDVWKEFGFSTIVYLAALAGINPSLYEAAEADGANRWKQTVYITIPMLMPIMIVLGTLSLGNVLNAGFEQILTLYSPLVYEKGDIIDTYVYRMGLVSGQYSFGTAFGLLKSIVSCLFIIAAYRLAYRYANYRVF